MKTIFFGSGNFAVKILEGILKMPFLEVVAVVTQPDKPAGRDKVLTPCPVKAALKDLQYAGKVYEPVKLRNTLEFSPILAEQQPEFILVADYGQIIPVEIIDYPKHKCLNVHGSLLPDLRGAVPAPIAILRGYNTTGVSIPVMTPGLDDGAIVASREAEIQADDTTFSLRMRLADIGIELLNQVLPDWFAGKIIATTQDESKATLTKQSDIAKEKAQVTRDTPVVLAERMVRAFSPWPIAWCSIKVNGKVKRLKILKATIVKQTETNFQELQQPQFTLAKVNKNIYLVLSDGILQLNQLQLEGKNVGSANEYLFLDKAEFV